VDHRWSDPRQAHPSAAELRSFIEESDEDAHLRVVRHLLGGCVACAERLRTLSGELRSPLPGGEPRGPRPNGRDVPHGYDAVFERAEEALSLFLSNGQPAEEPPGLLLAELAPLPADERVLPRRFRRVLPMLVKWLIGRSSAARFDEPEKMLHWALMARLAADSCSTAEAGSAARLADLRAWAWGDYGNALRVKGLLRAAEQSLATAQTCLGNGTGDPSLRSKLLAQTACLLFDKSDFTWAIQLAEKAGRISGAIGEYEEQANRLLTEANAWNHSGDAERAAVILERAISRPDFCRDPQWLLIARHNLTECYVRSGQRERAVALAERARQAPHQPKDPLIILRSLWVQGELFAELGYFETAEAALRSAHRGFLKKAMPQQVAQLCRRLVDLNREMGRHERSEQILAESLSILQGHAEPETLASVRALRDSR
jgi:tetratricopeptide (TPR) repeat protein